MDRLFERYLSLNIKDSKDAREQRVLATVKTNFRRRDSSFKEIYTRILTKELSQQSTIISSYFFLPLKKKKKF